MEKIEKLGFDNWFKDKVDLSKTNDFKIVRVISEKKLYCIKHNAICP